MPHRLKKLKVLVAEPNAAVADLLVASLRGVGVREITKVLDSNAAERVLANKPLDVAVIGFNLRPKSIAEVVVSLRRSRLINAHAPVIGIAAAVHARDLASAARAGVNKVLTVPMSAAALQTKLLELLATPAPPGGSFVEL